MLHLLNPHSGETDRPFVYVKISLLYLICIIFSTSNLSRFGPLFTMTSH
jgi:hypothetical protein